MKNNYINTKMDKHIIILINLMIREWNKNRTTEPWYTLDSNRHNVIIKYNIYKFLTNKQEDNG